MASLSKPSLFELVLSLAMLLFAANLAAIEPLWQRQFGDDFPIVTRIVEHEQRVVIARRSGLVERLDLLTGASVTTPVLVQGIDFDHFDAGSYPLEISHDGRILYLSEPVAHAFHAVNLQTGLTSETLPLNADQGDPYSARITETSPDDRFLVHVPDSSSSPQLFLLRTQPLDVLWTLGSLDGDIKSVDFSIDSSLLAVAYGDNEVAIHDVVTTVGIQLRQYTLPVSTDFIAFFENRETSLVAFEDGGEGIAINVISGEEQGRLEARVESFYLPAFVAPLVSPLLFAAPDTGGPHRFASFSLPSFHRFHNLNAPNTGTDHPIAQEIRKATDVTPTGSFFATVDSGTRTLSLFDLRGLEDPIRTFSVH